ncbi:MAG: hypothetical protein GY950_32560, partial [bacterium]|nr:hypothetical protein [bacterium]
MIDRRRFSLYFSLLFILCLCFFSCGSPEPKAEVEIRCRPGEISVFQGEKVMLAVEIENNSQNTLRREDGFNFSYHLYDGKGKTISFDNRRFNIPRVLRRRETTSFQIPVFFDHRESGDYVVEFDIVKEGAFWGSDKQWKTARVKLHLKSLVSAEFEKDYRPRICDTGNELLDREQYLLRMTLKNCEIIKDNKLFGFAPGSDYPAVWIRDTATFIAYAKHFYPLEALAAGVELFLEHQGENGAVVDWVDVSGKTGKNTVETDQESSLVLAAYEIAKDDGQWLDKIIKGKTVLQRLELALEWVWNERRDGKWNFLTSGFTADWGDVENTYPDERALKLSDRSTRVFSIYTQAKYIQAMDAFIKLSESEDKKKWLLRSNGLKAQTRKHLYLKDRGYFITHIVPSEDGKKYFEMEKEMLAVGGNAEAILAGLMTGAEIKRFMEVLEQRRRDYKLRTVSFTLIPPYPEGFFPHHLLRRPWNYQNGGEWDWIGGRVVSALFMKGFSKEAEKYLLEIAGKNLDNFCIFEWEDREGTGRGALFYVGAAGVIG